VCYFLNSASEANELALRLARTYTGREDIIVLEHAYHGNTTTLIDISPYKFNGPGGRGKKPWVHVAPQPDPHRRDDPRAGAEYARAVAEILKSVKPAAFIVESLPSVGGQVVFPPVISPGLQCASARRAACASPTKCRSDSDGWANGLGFQMQDTPEVKIVPDIVVFGKPMGNGFPLAGVVTTREIAAAFDQRHGVFQHVWRQSGACAAGSRAGCSGRRRAG